MSPKTLVAGEPSNKTLFLIASCHVFFALTFVTFYYFTHLINLGNDETTLSILRVLALGIGILIGIRVSRSVDRRRIYITDTGDAFILTIQRRELMLPDTCIIAMALYYEAQKSIVLGSGLKRYATLDLASEGFNTKLDISYIIRKHSPDTLKFFFQRNLERLIKEARSNLANGIPLEGVNWVINQEGLLIHFGKDKILIPSDSFEPTMIEDGKIEICKIGEDGRKISISALSRNSSVLFALLKKQIAD